MSKLKRLRLSLILGLFFGSHSLSSFYSTETGNQAVQESRHVYPKHFYVFDHSLRFLGKKKDETNTPARWATTQTRPIGSTLLHTR